MYQLWLEKKGNWGIRLSTIYSYTLNILLVKSMELQVLFLSHYFSSFFLIFVLQITICLGMLYVFLCENIYLHLCVVKLCIFYRYWVNVLYF